MRTLDSIISAATETLRPLLQEAFEAGRDVGREEATADLKSKIVGLLSAGQNASQDAAEPVVAPDLDVTSDKRATQGSVKPTIIRMIVEAAKAGLTTNEITKLTGFKLNSVRGTLWTLGKEGLAVKREGRWYPADNEPSQLHRIPEGEAEAVGASASHQSL